MKLKGRLIATAQRIPGLVVAVLQLQDKDRPERTKAGSGF